MTDTQITPEQADALDHARHLTEYGVPVFLAEPALTSDGEWDPEGGTGNTGYRFPSDWQHAVADADVLDEWRPGWALCAVTGHGVDVLDVDPRNGGDASLAAMKAEGLVPISYGRQRTPSGGTHDLIASLGVGKGKIKRLPGIDVLAGDSDGNGRSIAFLAPTEKVSKVTGEVVGYEWTIAPDLAVLEMLDGDYSGAALTEVLRAERPSMVRPEPREVDLSVLPTDAEVRKAVAVLAKAGREVREAAAGGRNESLIRHLPTLYQFVLGGCLAETDVDEQMQEAAAASGIAAEFDKVRKSAWKIADRGGADRPRIDTPADDFGPAELDGLFDATATLQHIRQAAHSRMVGAPALLCYMLGRVLTEVPPSVCLPPVIGGRASLNLGIAIVGTSGAGKSAMLAVSRELFGLEGMYQEDLERNVGSGEGLVQTFLEFNKEQNRNVLIADPRRILTVDEIDSLGATKNRSGATIGPTIRSALTGGSLGQENATADRKRHVGANSYRLVMVLGVQPTRSGVLLEDADAGTPQRLVWVKAADPTVDPSASWPGGLGWQMPALPPEIDYPDHIKAEVRSARLKQVKDGAEGLEGHMLLTRLKVATALALLHGETAITDQWWTIAGQIIGESMTVQEECRRVLSSEVQQSQNASAISKDRAEDAADGDRVRRCARAILNRLKKEPGEWLLSKSYRPAARLRECMDEALENLVASGQVEVEDYVSEKGTEARRVRYVG
ncbi:MAG: hypothetical protein JWO11_3915 [Nocardioides sp.]|nr:hypothetical protein [Nocardioides sp.]